MGRFARDQEYDSDYGSPFGTMELSDERIAFIRRVYLWFGASVLLAVVAGMATTMVPGLAKWAVAHRTALWIAEFALIIGSWFLRDRHPLNIAVLLAFAGITGVSVGAIALVLMSVGKAAVIGKAGVVTMMAFGGLTFYAFNTTRDFSFMRGMLVTGVWTVFGLGIAAWIFGFGGNGLWFLLSAAGALLGAGFVLYDTHNIIHHYEEGQEVGAAFGLYWSVWYLFMNLIQLFLLADD